MSVERQAVLAVWAEGVRVYSTPRARRCALVFFFFQAEDGIRDHCVTGVQTCALPICARRRRAERRATRSGGADQGGAPPRAPPARGLCRCRPGGARYGPRHLLLDRRRTSGTAFGT